MFGRPMLDHETRYEHAAEWIEIVRRLWTSEEEFDYDGRFFRIDKGIQDELKTWGAFLKAYRAQDWDAAEMTFRACLELHPNDGPAALFLKRTETLRRNAPGADWSSISQLEEK